VTSGDEFGEKIGKACLKPIFRSFSLLRAFLLPLNFKLELDKSAPVGKNVV
jgi:hypothetical protein